MIIRARTANYLTSAMYLPILRRIGTYYGSPRYWMMIRT